MLIIRDRVDNKYCVPAVYSVAPTVDPNCPKPEGSTITPTVGEQLVVSTSINVAIVAAYVTIIHGYIQIQFS